MMENEQFEAEAGPGSNFLATIPKIILDRKWFLIVPVVLSIIAGIAAYFVLPTVYRSEATLLVQSSQLPRDVIGQNAIDIVDRRIERIRQRLVSRPGLIDLINKHGLYRDEASSGSMSEVVQKMRSAIALDTLSADEGARGRSSTIAFRLRFDYSDPGKAQSVAQELTEKVLVLDASSTTEQASNTERFLTDQANALQEQIVELQGQIASIKAANGSVLSKGGMMLGGGGSYDVQIAALQKENTILTLQRETRADSAKRDPIVSAAEQQLASARAIYTDDHPDVRLAKQRLEEAKRLADQNVTKIPLDNIDEQIAFNNSQIARLQAAKLQGEARMAEALNAQARQPLVMQEISELQARLSGLNKQYQDVSNRLFRARAGVKAEDENMGERLSIIDPPTIPNEPISPDMLKIAAGALGGGVALGLFLVFGLEFLFQPIRDPNVLERLTGDQPIGMVPTMVSEERARMLGQPFWKRWAGSRS